MLSTTKTFTVNQLPVELYNDAQQMGEAAAQRVAETLKQAVSARGEANAIFATGNSQQPLYDALHKRTDIPWSNVRIFHMDEYIGISKTHTASFRYTLQKELVEPLKPLEFFGVEGDAADADEAMRSYEALLKQFPPDLCCMGIGENGHLAFNDPPFAKFHEDALVKRVTLDTVSRQQQVNEGHFPTLADVPKEAITLTITALLLAPTVIVTVPEKRKAHAVQQALEGPIHEDLPASILQTTPQATLYLDAQAASKLSRFV